MRNRTVGRPPSRALTASARIQPSSSRPSRAPPPPDDVGPHCQLKTLDQPVIPAPGKDRTQVALERARLDPAEHRDARGPNVQGAAPDPMCTPPVPFQASQ
jgi:hypothetical protein